MDRIEFKLRELEHDWGFDSNVEIDDSWGAATMRAYGAYTALLWVREQLTHGSRQRGDMVTKKAKRYAVQHAWVGEVAYKRSQWITLWTTCRLTRDDARIAINEHIQAHNDDYDIRRISKFVR